jgi:hypothetical protein
MLVPPTAPLVLGLQAPDDLSREREGHGRAGGQQMVELGLAQTHQHRVAHRHHGGRPRVVGEQAHLAHHLAARDLAHDTLAAVVAGDADAQAPADQHEQGVAHLALLQQRLPAGQFHPRQLLRQQRQCSPIDIAEKVIQVPAQQVVEIVRTVGHVQGRRGGRRCRASLQA